MTLHTQEDNGGPTALPGHEKAREQPDYAALARALRNRMPVPDRVFDEIFPIDARWRSSVYWTPVAVAARAARLLTQELPAKVHVTRVPQRRRAAILDIGSGIGKFCIIAAAAEQTEVVGVEQRPHLAEIARRAAEKLGVRATFDAATRLQEIEPSHFDGIYLYNPFAENLCEARDHIDSSVELSEHRYWNDIAATERLLWKAPVGTRVVTYCGFGGDIPDGYTLEVREHVNGSLELWVKHRPSVRELRRTPRPRTTKMPW